jgi:hypothetical protein
MKYSKETQKLKKQILAASKLGEQLGTRATIQLHMRSDEEQQMVNEVAPLIGLSRDEVAPTCWKHSSSEGFWFYIFDFWRSKDEER